jgi:hypothetical protein
MAADQMRGAAAGAPLRRPIGHRLGDFGIAGQPEVIVAGEIEHFFAVDRSNPPAGRFQHAAAAGQAGGGDEFGEFGLERAHFMHSLFGFFQHFGGEFGLQVLVAN